MPEISVIICTHNPREDYLHRVLAALKTQTLRQEQWELLLVDNASEKPPAAARDVSWHPNARLVREDKTGLTHARLRGIAESKGDLLVFADDDNVLRADYLRACLKIGADFPWLGAWGGSCLPEYEVEPSAELRPWLGGLVIEKLTRSYWAKLQRRSEACPSGAGMVVRRKQALHYRELVLHDPARQALGRSGKQLGGGEDSDMALCGFDLGLGTGRFPELELTHLIPARRLTLEYLAGIHEGFGFSGVVLETLYQRTPIAGQMQSGSLKIVLLRILMFATGKSRVEQRIRLAEERGRLQAQRKLGQMGHSDPATNKSSGPQMPG